MRRSLAMTMALLLAACGVACTPGDGSPPTSTIVVPPPAPLWADEFNEGLDPAWRVYDNTYGSGGGILSGNSPDAVDVHDGLLQMTASRIPTHGLPFQGAIIGTRDTGRYFPAFARFEFRAKLYPGGQGVWPAFWLRHRNGSSTGEVDVMEWFYSQRPTATTATLHLDGKSNVSKRDVTFDPTEFHVWAVDITPEGSAARFTFSLDGVDYHTYLDTAHEWANTVDLLSTWDIAIDQWVGGTWVGSPDGPLGVLGNGRCSLGGSPPNCVTTGLHLATLPATMYVDWVRVYV